MGFHTDSKDSYVRAAKTYIPRSGPATRRGEQHFQDTGMLDPLVDPSAMGVIRPSRIPLTVVRSGPHKGMWRAAVGCPQTVEAQADTTGSMGGNVDIIVKALPDVPDLMGSVAPEFDLQYSLGVFNDVVDRVVLCRPQYERTAERIMEQQSMLVPCRGGGDGAEDPHYGIFGAAYLTDAYINRVGLRRYYFLTSDATAHDYFDVRTLKRVFGDEVFDKVAENGFSVDPKDLPSIREVVEDLLEQAHAFFLQVSGDSHTTRFWKPIFGSERIVQIPDTHWLPHIQAVIMGLTEGTLALDGVVDFLTHNNVKKETAKQIRDGVANIPIGAQVPLRKKLGKQGLILPQKGDLFADKTDLWPTIRAADLDTAEVEDMEAEDSDGDVAEPAEGPQWKL